MPVSNIKYGLNFNYVEPVNLYGCEFDDDIFIGPFIEIQAAVTVGSNANTEPFIYLFNVTIGKDCFIGHGVVFTNDKFSNGKVNFDKPFENTNVNYCIDRFKFYNFANYNCW